MPEEKMGLPSSKWQADDAGEDYRHDGNGDELNEDGVLFYVNKSGCPLDKPTWNRMWEHVAKIHPDGSDMITSIRNKTYLPEVPIPRYQVHLASTIDKKIEMAQRYMEELQYNHTGTQFFEIRKNRPISGLMETAKEMMQGALPIKCLEAIILGAYLTNEFLSVDRFPLSFKTNFLGNTHRHVVLAVYHNGYYGAIGMSRRKELMYKPLIFTKLSKMVLDFVASYKKYKHVVKKVAAGLQIPHDPYSYEQIHWRAIAVRPTTKKGLTDEQCRDIDRHAREMKSQVKLVETIQQCYAPQKPFRRPDKTYPNGKFRTTGTSRSARKKKHRSSAQNRVRTVSESYHAAKSSSELSPEPKTRRPGEESEKPQHPLTGGGYQVRV